MASNSIVTRYKNAEGMVGSVRSYTAVVEQEMVPATEQAVQGEPLGRCRAAEKTDLVTTHEARGECEHVLVDELALGELAEQSWPTLAVQPANATVPQLGQQPSQVDRPGAALQRIDARGKAGQIGARRVDEQRSRAVPLEKRLVDRDVPRAAHDHEQRQGLLAPGSAPSCSGPRHRRSSIAFGPGCPRAHQDGVGQRPLGKEELMVGVRSEGSRPAVYCVRPVEAHHHVRRHPGSRPWWNAGVAGEQLHEALFIQRRLHPATGCDLMHGSDRIRWMSIHRVVLNVWTSRRCEDHRDAASAMTVSEMIGKARAISPRCVPLRLSEVVSDQGLFT